MKQPNFDRLEIELDWSQITRIMNEKGDYATPVESALVQKYGKRLRKRGELNPSFRRQNFKKRFVNIGFLFLQKY